MSNKIIHEEFIQKLDNKFPNRDYKVISEYKGSNRKIKVENKYGVCSIRASILLDGCNLSLVSAIDKNKFFINRAKEIHNNFYDYSETNYINSDNKIKIICKKHGGFYQNPKIHLLKAGCPKCAIENRSKKRVTTQEDFISKCKNKHGNKYDYSLVNYKNSKTSIKIICPTHGIFTQVAITHLKKGCYYCGRNRIYENARKNPTGWSYKSWQKAAEKSNNFDSFKVYIIKCWNQDEKFYKIGRTFRKVKDRFIDSNMPYNYEILKIEILKCSRDACKREKFLKDINEKYKPKIKFKGYTECFKTLNLQTNQT